MRTLLRVGATVAVVIIAALVINACWPEPSADKSQSAVPPVPAPVAGTQVTIRAFVSSFFAEGVPYNEARGFGVAAVPELLALLNDPSMADARSNIAVTLGMIGGDTAENELKKLVEQGSGKLTQPEFSVRLDALMSLGYATKLATNGVTLTYLISGLQPAMWASKVSWQRPDGGNPFSRLRERSIIALGLSGNPRAEIALKDLLTSGGGLGGRGGSVQLTPNDQAVIAEAIRANEYLATHSLSQYFKEYK